MTLRKIFIEIAKQHYPESKGYIWRFNLDETSLTVSNAAKEPIFTLYPKNQVKVHIRNHLDKVNEIADFARLEKMVESMG